MGKKRIKTIQSDKLKLNKKKAKKKARRNVEAGRVYIKSNYNNTIITFTDEKGDVLASASCGMLGFKGAKKATPYAASLLVKETITKLRPVGLKKVKVFIKGVGYARDHAIRALAFNGLDLIFIKDITPMPHGGCRPRKPRRV